MQPFGILLLAVLVLPWINPFASGPSATVTPTLVCAGCVGVVLLLVRPDRVPRLFAMFFIATCALFTLTSAAFGLEWLASGLAALMVFASGAVAAASVAPQRLPVGLGLSPKQAVVWSWLVAALISAAIALPQYFGGAEHLYPWVSASPDGTAYANLRQRNQLATLTVMGMFALLWCIRACGTPDAPPSIAKDEPLAPTAVRARWAALAGALLVAVNAMTTSRAGLVELALLLLLAWCWRASLPRPTRLLVWLAAPLYAASAWVLPWLQGSSASSAFVRMAEVQVNCGDRRLLWSNVWELVLQKPWTGWGWRELAWAHYNAHFEERFCLILDNAHNLPLHLAVELGLPVALVVSAALVWAVWRGKPWRETDATRQLAWGVLLAVGVHSMVEYPLWYGPFQMAAGLAVGLLARPATENPPFFERKAANARVFSCFVAIVLIASSLWAAREYHRVSQIYLPPQERDAGLRDDTLRKVSGSWLFADQANFAKLSTTPVTRENAAEQRALAQRLLHFSPEPRVIEVLIETASLMGDTDAAVAELRRYRAAFPQDYALWQKNNRQTPAPAP